MKQPIYRLGRRVYVPGMMMSGTVIGRHLKQSDASDPDQGKPCHLVLLDRPRFGLHVIHALSREIISETGQEPDEEGVTERSTREYHRS